MFCHNCGANLPDGTAVCNVCGCQLRRPQQPAPQQPAPQQPAPQQPAPQQPAYQQPAPQQPAYQQPAAQQPAYQQPAAPVRPIPISKKDYLATKASPQVKKNAGLVTITFILTLVLVIASAVAPLTISVFDIPVIDMIFTLAGDEAGDPDDLIENLEDSYDQAKAEYKYEKETMDKDEREAAEKLLDGLDKFIENSSILNFKSLVSLTNETADEFDANMDIDEIEEIGGILDIVIGALVGFFILPLLLTVLAGLNKSTGLTVGALIFTVLNQVVLCGFVWVVLSLVIFILQAVFCSKINKAYQNYRLGKAMA